MAPGLHHSNLSSKSQTLLCLWNDFLFLMTSSRPLSQMPRPASCPLISMDEIKSSNTTFFVMYFWVQQTTNHYVHKAGCECRFMYCQWNNMFINNQGWILQPASWMTHDCTKIWTMWANILPPDTRRDSVWLKVGIKHQISTRLTPTAGRQFQTLPARKLFMEIFSTTACTHTHLHTHTVWTVNYFDIASGVMQFFLRGHSLPVNK